MRLPFPERIPLDYAILFAVALFGVQQFEGTAQYFSVGCFLFVVLSALAFNIAGGLTRTAGAYIFFYSTLVVLVGVVYKALLGEPAQSNLADPTTTIEAYVGSIAALLVAAFLSRRFLRPAGLLQGFLKEEQMYRSCVGCMIVGATAQFALGLLGDNAGWLESAFGQLNQLIPLGIIIGVIYEIRRSGGTRSINLPVLLGGAYFFMIGLLNYSKQGMFVPLVCWIVPVCALRYRLSRSQILYVVAATVFIFYYLVPFAQYGRRYREPGASLQRQAAIAIPLLENIDETRRIYNQEQQNASVGSLGAYYNTPQGFFDRLQMVSVDDALVNITDQGKVFGIWPIGAELLNAIPHVFWPNKPSFTLGNMYAHEIGGMSDEDTTTGISFSPTAEGFHWARWTGIFVIAPLIWFVFFIEFDLLFGDLRATPWGLLVLTLLTQVAPEGGLSALIYFMTFTTEAFIFCAVFAGWFAPLIASAAVGPERRWRAGELSLKPALNPQRPA